MSLHSDLNEVLTPYAQRIKGLVTANDEIKADLDESVALIRSGSVHPSVVWENGSINSSNGQDGGGNKQRRTHGYISIGDYDFVANITKPATTSLSMYLCEYDATKTYLGITSRNNTGDLTPQNAQCKFVRVWTYSNTVAQNEQESYITLTIINAESVSNVVNSVSEKINVQQYNNALHAFDLLNSSVLYRADRIEIGATHNNESGNTTYIYKTITQTSEVGCVWIRIKEISNARSKSVIAYFYNSATVQNPETMLASQQISDACIKEGALIIPPEGILSLRIILYPSVNGGLTETYAVYSDIFIGLTKYRINPIDLIRKEENAVPYYYFQNDYLKNKVAVIRQTITESEGNYDAFIFCTDQHWRLNARNSPSLIRYLSDELNIKRLFNGGDFADGINIDALKAFKKSINGAVYNICGNHEYMNYLEEDCEQVGYTITEAEVWLYLNGGLTDAVIGDPQRQYYYVDNPTQKMRYIILSVFADNGASAIGSFDTAQQTWFRDVALNNMPTGYTAVVFAHTIYPVYYDDDTISIYPFAEPIVNIADAYNGAGEIACLIQGHAHVDGMTVTSGGIPVFITTCDKYLPWINNGTNMEPNLVANRHLGTITEQAFDVVVVDKTNKKVSCIRIGAPADNGTGAKLEIRQQNYGT